jgi:hypothetical protein
MVLAKKAWPVNPKNNLKTMKIATYNNGIKSRKLARVARTPDIACLQKLT